MNRRRHLAISSEHMECRLVLSPTGLANPRVVLNANDDAAVNNTDDADRPADDGRAQQRVEQRGRPATKQETTDVKTKPSEPQATPSDDRKSAPTATDPAHNDHSATTSETERIRDADGRQPSEQTTSPEPQRTPAADSSTNTERDAVSAERNKDIAPTEEPTRPTETRSRDETSVTPMSSPETHRKETDIRPVATTDADTQPPDRTTTKPTIDATRVDDTSVKVRPVRTADQPTAVRPVATTPINDVTTAVRPVPTEATRERTVDDSATPAVVAVRTKNLTRVTSDADTSTARLSTRTFGDELNDQRLDTVKKNLNETTTAAVAQIDPATAVTAVVASAATEMRLAPSIDDRVELLLPIAEPALPSGSILPKAAFHNTSSQIAYVRFPSSSDTTLDQDRVLLGELLSSSTDVRADVVASQTLFADATRLGLMLAAISHAGRRSGSMLAVSDVLDDPKNDGCLHVPERRRRRSFGGRRSPIFRNGSQRRDNPLETIEERTSIPASPSCDVLFADAAMMSVLFHEAEQRSSGSSRWNQTTVLGGLAAGTGGLAARRARQLRRRKAANIRPRPPEPRHHGKTLVFAD